MRLISVTDADPNRPPSLSPDPSEPLHQADSESSSNLRKLHRYLVFLDILLPVAWTVVASMGHIFHTLLNFVFLFFYSVSVHSPRGVLARLARPPTLIVLISLFLSILYLIAEVVIFSLTNNDIDIRTIEWLDIISASDSAQIPGIVYPVIVVIILDIMFLIASRTVDLDWFTASKGYTVRKVSSILGILFVLALSGVAVSGIGVGQKEVYTIELPIVHLLTCLVFALRSRPVAPLAAKAFWVFMLLVLTHAIVMVSLEKEPNKSFPRSVRVAVTFAATYLASIFLSHNLFSAASSVRLICHRKFPLAVRRISELTIIACAGYFCLSELSWISFAAFILPAIISLGPLSVLARCGRPLFAIVVLLVLGQTITGWFDKKYGFGLDGVFLGVAISAAFISGSGLRHDAALNQPTQSAALTAFFSAISGVVLLGIYLLTAYCTAKWEAILVTGLLVLEVLMALSGAYTTFGFFVLVFVSIGIAFAQLTLILLVNQAGVHISTDWYNLLFIGTMPSSRAAFPVVWQPLAIFVLALILRHTFVIPVGDVVRACEWLLIPLSMICAIIFTRNSAFKVVYIVALVILMTASSKKHAKLRSIVLLIDFFAKVIQLFCVTMYRFNDLRNYIIWQLVRTILGFPANDAPPDDVWSPVILIGAILSISIRYTFPPQTTRVVTGKVLQSFKILKALFRQFAVYVFMVAVFLGEVVGDSASLLQTAFLVFLCLDRMRTKRTGTVGFLLFLLFLLAYVVQVSQDLVQLPLSVQNIFDLIGPSVSKPLSHFISLITLFTGFHYSRYNPERVVLPEIIQRIGHYLARNLLVALQLVLALSTLQSGKVIGLSSALFSFVIILKREVTGAYLRIVNLIFLAVTTYVMIFSIHPLSKVNKWTDYFLLTGADRQDRMYSFLPLIVETLVMEFGIGLTPGFGYTILTAYAFPIFSSIVFVVACSTFNWVLEVFAVGWLVVIYFGLDSPRARTRGVYSALICTAIWLTAKALRGSPVWPGGTPSWLDDALGLTHGSNAAWTAIFVLEFLLLAMFRSVDHQEVEARQATRRDWRLRRQEILQELRGIDEQFINEHFTYTLAQYQVDFHVLTDDRGYLPAIVAPSMAVPDAEDPPESWLAIGLRALKDAVAAVVDSVLGTLMQLADINLEPSISVVSLRRLRDFMAGMLQRYRETHSIEVPPEWRDFSQTIPYAFPRHFRSIALLKLHRNARARRWSLFRRYISVNLRSVADSLLILLAAFYPLSGASIVALAWFVIVHVCVSFRLPSRLPYFICSAVVMFIRSLVQQPIIIDAVNHARDLDLRDHPVPLFGVFGIDPTGQFGIDSALFILSLLGIAVSYSHPAAPNPPDFFARITTVSGRKIHFAALIFLVDFVAFLVLLLGYGTWRTTGSGLAASIGSSISPFFVLILIAQFVFMIIVQVAIMRRSPRFFILTCFSGALVTFVLYVFAIPQMTDGGCLSSPSFRLFGFARCLAQLLISCQCASGFLHAPPRAVMKRPLVVMVSEMAFRLIPFLFEVMTVMRWIASNSTISLFDYLIVQELKSKLKERDASRVLFPPAKAKSRIVGVLVLAGLIALLFVPLLVMSSNETVSIVNPGSVATASFGVSGLPTFYDNQVAIAGRILAESERRQITGNDLARFWQSPLEQVQLIDLPFGSMREWTVSADALNESDTYLKQPDAVCYPYGSLQFIMAKATTSNRVQTVTLELAGDQLPAEARKNLTAALEKNSSSIFIPALLPMFVTVGYDEAPKSISNYAYKVEFRYVNATNGNGPYWQMKSYPPQISGLPGFMTNTAGISRVLIWSEKVPNAITGTMMASTGGILGLYSFILLTIGQWIAGWVAGLFVDLWLSRMVNPQRLLNIVLALEAYELSGEYDKEFELSELLLENLRFTGRVVQMTNAPGPEP